MDGDLDNKLEKMELFNGWNDKNEKIIISIGENSASYKWMHEQSSRNYNNINKILNIIMIILSTSLSAETLFTQNELFYINIIRKILVYILTILTVVQNFLKYEKLASSHINSAIKFATLYHSIQQEMCMYRRNRKKATEYVTNIIKQYDSLVLNSPVINNIVLEHFKKTFKIDLPNIADRQKIDVVIETPENNIQKDLNLCNLDNISNIFQIQGEISDNDIQNCSMVELQEIKKKYKIV